VIGADVYPDPALAKTPGFRYTAVGELLAGSDVVTLHCPHEPGAKPLVDAAALASMKKGALLVNTARWGLVDPDATLGALASGKLAGYAVDAFETEPPAAHALLAHERVVTTPHVGAYTAESVARATRVAVDNLLAVLGKGA
jgi:phosphoglycerate dehydrogenase-like enzyme